MRNRSNTLDVLKGLAIIAVVFYHAGLMTYGYLGVEVFLVIAGFLTTRGIWGATEKCSFDYLSFLKKRLVRLWPLTLVVSTTALIGGYAWMFPDNFKINCETVAGTSVFANNFVQYITSGNYWDTSNECKPLMHTWYLGIMMQFYLIWPLMFLLLNRIKGKNILPATQWSMVGIFIVSLSIYLLPYTSDAARFYLLPSRMFEFAAGGLLAIPTHNLTLRKWGGQISLFLIVVLMAINNTINIEQARLLLTVAITTTVVYWTTNNNGETLDLNIRPLAFLGKASFSLYLWHQVILAFYRYVFNSNPSVLELCVVIVVSLGIGLLSYTYIERPLGNIIKSKRSQNLCIAICCVIAFVLTTISVHFYKNNGVVRDYPEFGIVASKPYENIPSSYTDRVAAYDKDFEQNNKKNVLVIGDSYGRDWTNVLLESGVDSIANISYHMNDDEVAAERIMKADVIFIANNTLLSEEYSFVTPYLLGRNYYRVGLKSFDIDMRHFYITSKHDDVFYNTTVRPTEAVLNVNKIERSIFGDRYIDVQASISEPDGRVRLFNEERKLITPDIGHFTQAGAQLCAHKIDVLRYLQ